MPPYEAPLDAPTPPTVPPSPSLPAVFWWQGIGLVLWLFLANSWTLDDYDRSAVGMALLLLIELAGTRPSKKSSVPTFRPLAWSGASSIVLFFVLPLFTPIFLEEVIAWVSLLLMVFYFFIWSILLQAQEEHVSFPRLILGVVLFFFYLFLFVNKFVDDYIPVEMLFVVIPAFFLCIYFIYKYWNTSGRERKKLIQNSGIVRSPQLLHLIWTTFISFY